LILAPHHGSARSNPFRFAQWSAPEYVVISGARSPGDVRSLAGVKDAFRLGGAEVFHTAEDGCIRVEVSQRGLMMTGFRPHVRGLPSTPTVANLFQVE
jgi:competence protein ComEC